jgi:hypothetical protein
VVQVPLRVGELAGPPRRQAPVGRIGRRPANCPPPTKPSSGEGNAAFVVPQLSPLALGQRPLLLCRAGTGLDLELGTGVAARIGEAQVGLRVHELPI